MDRTVKRVKHVLRPDSDINPNGQYDVLNIDGHVNMCLGQAQEVLRAEPPSGFGEFERDNLIVFLDCLKYSHRTIREFLRLEISSSTVDVLAVARLQVEALYTFCFCLQAAENVRHYLKYGWKQKYVRFLLLSEEYCQLDRFSKYFTDAFKTLSLMQQQLGVSEEERLTVDEEQLGTLLPQGAKRSRIEKFPTPGGIVDKISDRNLRAMLERFYVEYEWLCIFAHGGSDSAVFKVALDRRSPVQACLSSSQREDLFQRYIAETAITYSFISAVQCATEVASRCPNCLELQVKLSAAWADLLRVSLWAVPVWEMRAKGVLPPLIT